MVDAKREPAGRTGTARGRILVALLAVLTLASTAPGQRTIRIAGDRLSGVVLPVEPLDGDIELHALRGWAWTVDDTKRLILEGDVTVRIAGFRFDSDAAAVWINRLPSGLGLINQIAVYFDEVDNPTHRAGLGVAGRRLLVTGSARGEVTLDVALLQRKRPRGGRLRDRAEDRLAAHIQRVIGEPQALHSYPQVDRPTAPRQFMPVPGGKVRPEDYELPKQIELPPRRDRYPWLRDPVATVSVSANEIRIVPGEHENTITAIGALVVNYSALNRRDEFSQLTLSADRAVIFTEPGSLEEMAGWEFDASLVRGIYLEGNVIATANDDEYRVRAPRVYYDFTTGRAIMLDAVLRTYARRGRVPIYARAGEMRQIAENQWDAQDVRVTTSEFYTGHLALGARRVIVTRRPVDREQEDEQESETLTHFDAQHITLRAGGTPFFYWPRFTGTVRDIPLKSVEIGTRDNDGLRIETKWNVFSLLDVDTPEGVEGDLIVDGFTKRGAGLGLQFNYDVAAGFGDLELYGMFDDGVDRTSTGREIRQNDEFRGLALWEHRTKLSQYWTMQAQLSYITDETFITSWREEDFRERREYETSLYFKRQKDRAALTMLAKYDLDDFISNDYLLASQPYQVDKFPELTYRRYGDPWLGNKMTYSTENRVSRMRLSLERHTPRELGVSGRAFGLGNDDQINDALQMLGLETKFITRYDTRHELAWPTQWGIFKLSPFVVARLTAYDHDFAAYSEDADEFRIFGAGGLRVNTQFQRVDNRIESRFFDLHRVRHIIEPSMTVWFGHSDVSDDDLPVYDWEVESIGTAAAVRLGVRNTWQTQRGGPGRWRCVDFLTADTNLVLNSRDANRESPIAQFFDYRPEYSQFGHHVQQSVLWLVSDTLSIAGESVIDLDESAVSRGSVGAELRHSPIFSTFTELRYIDVSDTELLGIGWNYRLTPKYRVSLSPQWDFREDEFRAVSLRLVRTFPDFELTLQVRHDEIKDDTSFAATVGLVEF